MATREVIGTILKANGTPWEDFQLKFTVQPSTYSEDAIYPEHTVSTLTEDDGTFSATLNTDITYLVEYPDVYALQGGGGTKYPVGSRYTIVVPEDDGPVSLEDLRAASNGPAALPSMLTLINNAVNPVIASVSDLEDVVAEKADQSDLDSTNSTVSTHTTQIASKADTTTVNSALALKANTSDVTAGLALKADAAATTSALAGKASTSALEAVADDLDDAVTLIGAKADASTTTAALATKADATATTSALALKATISSVDAIDARVDDTESAVSRVDPGTPLAEGDIIIGGASGPEVLAKGGSQTRLVIINDGANDRPAWVKETVFSVSNPVPGTETVFAEMGGENVTTVFEAWADFAATLPSGATITVPDGYGEVSGIIVPSKVNFSGPLGHAFSDRSGPGNETAVTLRLPDGVNEPMFTFQGDGGAVRGTSAIGPGDQKMQESVLANMKLEGNRNGQTSPDADLIRLHQVWDVNLSGISLQNAMGFGVRVLDCNGIRLSDVTHVGAPLYFESLGDSFIFGAEGGGSHPYFGPVSWYTGPGQQIEGNRCIGAEWFNAGPVRRSYIPNTGTDVLTFGSAHFLNDGVPVRFTAASGGAIPGGLVGGTIYYVKVLSPTTLTLAAAPGDIASGPYIDITSSGTGVQYLEYGGPWSRVCTADDTTDVITTVTAHGLTNDTPVIFKTTSVRPGGIISARTYYIHVLSTTTFKIATTRKNRAAGTFVNITSAGSGVQTVQCGEMTNLYVNDPTFAYSLSFVGGRYDQSRGPNVVIDGAKYIRFLGGLNKSAGLGNTTPQPGVRVQNSASIVEVNDEVDGSSHTSGDQVSNQGYGVQADSTSTGVIVPTDTSSIHNHSVKNIDIPNLGKRHFASLALTAFSPFTATPTALEAFATSRRRVWLLDAATDETIGTTFWPAPYWETIAPVVSVANAGAGSGDFILAVSMESFGIGESVNVVDTYSSSITTTAGAQYIPQEVRFPAFTLTAGEEVFLRISRDADNAADTLANDIAILGVRIERAS